MEITTPLHTNLLDRYQKIRQQTESICKPLAAEDFVVQPVVHVSPPKWHLAHTTWFFETFLLQKFVTDYKVFDQEYNYLFNSYYESVGDRVLRANRGNITRPLVADIFAYRSYVDQALEKFVEDSSELGEEFFGILEIGLHHEQQHQELLITDLKYILGHNPIFPPYTDQTLPQSNSTSSDVNFSEVPEGVYSIGHEGHGFCFDNELGTHQVYLPAFRIMDRLITNREYIEFIEAGGYSDFRFWMMEGWEWINSQNIYAPLYWHQKKAGWYSYNLFGLQKVVKDAPVTHVSFYEADAYARWRGLRLPTEYEWETACKYYQPTIPQNALLQEEGIFTPLAAATGNAQFFGDTWEWTGSAYRPYPYFQHADGALGEYNGKFMINQMVLRGGSCATPRDHIRATYRNFFHPQLRWQFTGIRLASYL
jgi:ergothioneine biosynthesis protein EgtB